MREGLTSGARVRWEDGELELRPRERFLPLLRAGVEAAPDRPEPRRRLARLLLQTEQLEELEELATPALDDPGADPEVLHCLGLGALATERPELALRALRRAVDLGFTHSLGALANVLRDLGRDDEALTAALQALELDPSNHSASGVVARILLERGERERLWSLCQEIRRGGGWGAYLPSAMAVCARTGEQHREVERLVGREAWFLRRDLGLAPEFSRRLAEELLDLMGTGDLPRRKASTGTGRRIDQLQVVARTNPVVAELFAALRAAIEEYLAEREDALADELLGQQLGGRLPDELSLGAWALAMRGDGHEEWHMHPSGWLSGVYYVEVPDMTASAAEHPGAIDFGPFPFTGVEEVPSWPPWRIAPRTGEMLLFPSSYAHRTWPTGVDEDRIVVAFDVLAAHPAEA
ncbi:MAG TPA: putative 2OG-Fe(II) oxygenase [Thermoleophilaceae bacterium]|jgi:uncharacterized protein (TIGR02466 family)